MKAICLAIALLALPISVRAADIDPAVVQLWDVVYTTEGSVLKGIIVEQVPGQSLRVVLVGGTSIVVPIANVVRFTKELNPAFAHGSSVQAAAGPAPAALTATSGLRIGLLPGLAHHFEGDSTTFFLAARFGWELAFDQWGLTPGVVVNFTPDVGTYGAAGIGGMAAARAAYRGSTISPFIGFGIGADIVSGDASLAVEMGGGVDLLVHRRIALTAEAKYHRGFGSTYVQSLSFGAIGIGVELRL